MTPSSCYTTILCEGFDDRSFWAGWLLANGWQKAEQTSHLEGDAKGLYIYSSKSPENSSYVVVRPCDGYPKLKKSLPLKVASIHKHLNDETQIGRAHV